MSNPKYTFVLLDPTKDEQIVELHAFLEEHTEEGENDTLETHRCALNGKRHDGTPSGIPYFAEVARNTETGKLANVTMFGLVPMKGGRNLALTYCYTADDDQRQGLATVNYDKGVGRAQEIAAGLGEEILQITAESSQAFRKFGESVGLYRVYCRTGSTVRQVQYVQSALEEGGEEVPEHLMVGFINPDSLSQNEKIARLIAGAHAIQVWSSPKDAHEAEFNAQFDGIDELLLLNAAEVQNYDDLDFNVIEFDDADEDEVEVEDIEIIEVGE